MDRVGPLMKSLLLKLFLALSLSVNLAALWYWKTKGPWLNELEFAKNYCRHHDSILENSVLTLQLASDALPDLARKSLCTSISEQMLYLNRCLDVIEEAGERMPGEDHIRRGTTGALNTMKLKGIPHLFVNVKGPYSPDFPARPKTTVPMNEYLESRKKPFEPAPGEVPDRSLGAPLGEPVGK